MYYQRRKSLREKYESKMDFESFKSLVGSIASWTKMESEDYQPRQLKVANSFLHQLFKQFDIHHTQSLSFQVREMLAFYSLLLTVFNRMSFLVLVPFIKEI